GRSRRPPIGMLHESRNDCSGASPFFSCGSRTADENLAAAWRVRRAGSAVGSFNGYLADVRIKLESRDRSRRIHRSLKRFVQFRARHIIRREERYADSMQSGLDRDARRRTASRVAGVRNFSIPIEYFDALAVDRDLELLTFDLAQHGLEVTGDAFNLE